MSSFPNGCHYCRLEFDPDFEVLVTGDGTKPVFIALTPSTNPGDDVMIPNHGFVAYERVVPLTEGVTGQPPFAEK